MRIVIGKINIMDVNDCQFFKRTEKDGGYSIRFNGLYTDNPSSRIALYDTEEQRDYNFQRIIDGLASGVAHLQSVDDEWPLASYEEMAKEIVAQRQTGQTNS